MEALSEYACFRPLLSSTLFFLGSVQNADPENVGL
jgi:hypothetical protein